MKGFMKKLIEKHIPVCFCEDGYLEKIIDVICTPKIMSRKNILMLAYSIGADEEETNELLIYMGYSPLYIKRREDAIWKYFLRKRKDINSIVDMIYPQIEDEMQQTELIS